MPAEEFSARSLLLLSSRLCPPLHIFTLSGLAIDMGLWFKDFPLHACNIIHFVLKIITREWRRLKEKWKSCTDVLSLLPRLSTASLSLSSLFCQPFGFERLTHPCRIVKEGGMFISSAISSSIFSASNSTTLNQTSKGLVKTVIPFVLMSFHSENVYNELLSLYTPQRNVCKPWDVFQTFWQPPVQRLTLTQKIGSYKTWAKLAKGRKISFCS